jgi:hypothetical protein
MQFRHAKWPVLLALLAGCGRTPLDEWPSPQPTAVEKDAGSAAPPATGGTGGSGNTGGAPPIVDAAVDRLVPIDVPDPVPQVSCPRSTSTQPRRTVQLEGVVRGGPAARADWTVIAAPSGSSASRAPVAGTSLEFTPDVTGEYRLRFAAVDARGAGQACEVMVTARALPPVVFCPRDTSTSVDREVMLTADARDDDGPVKPHWSASSPLATVSPPDALTTRFHAHQPGSYAVTFVATDIDGASASCTTTVRVLPATMAFCPPSGQKYVRLREATFAVKVDNPSLVTARWMLTRRPAGSQAEPSVTGGLSTELTPDRLGDYLLEFVGRAPDGTEARCETAFTAVSEPPSLDCSDIDTRPLVDTDIAAATSDNGEIVRWRWSLDSQPPGSAVKPMFPEGDSFTFKPDLAGDYRFTLEITDDEALSARCTFSVRAAAEEGLRVEMFWETGDTDMDIHLLSPVARRWFDEESHQDCFYSNCTVTPPNWSNPATDADDPHLDLDDTDGFGPENVNVDRPAAGVYRVGVHAYSGYGNVTVRLYCGGSRLEPRATVGPVSLDPDQFWRVADVELSADGRCQVRRLVQPGGAPDVVPRTDAEMSR